MNQVARYALSFTSGGLLIAEGQRALEIWRRSADWTSVRAELMEANSLQLRTVQSRRTLSREVVGRLSKLETEELHLLGTASPQERGHIMWVAACRRYALLGEFAEEVVREHMLLLTPSLRLQDFDSFTREKSLWHPELNALADTTRRKLRQNTFRMLREAGLLMEDGVIPRVFLSTRLEELLGTHDPSDLRLFPTMQGGAR